MAAPKKVTVFTVTCRACGEQEGDGIIAIVRGPVKARRQAAEHLYTRSALEPPAGRHVCTITPKRVDPRDMPDLEPSA